MRTMIAIPAYNCSAQLPRVLSGIKNSNVLNKVDHIAIIDNCSTDSTVSECLKAIQENGLEKKVILYQNENNLGLGGSQKRAIKIAKELSMDYLIILHGDDQANTSDIFILLDKIEKHPEHAAILGSRFLKDSKLLGYQKTRILGNRVLNFIYTFVSFKKTYDLGSGLNLYNLRYINQIDIRELSNQFIFNTELLLEIYSHRFSYLFVPITWKETDQISNAKNFSVAKQMFLSLVKWRFNFKKRNKN